MNLNIILIFLLLVLGLITFINEFNKEKGKKSSIWIFVLILLSILVAITQVIIASNEEEEELYSAESGSFLENKAGNKKVTYLIGSDSYIGFENITFKGFIGCQREILSSRIENGALVISSFLYDKEGNIVAKIVDNEWLVNPKFMWDKNFDNEAFEVVDDKEEVIFQVELSGNTLRIRGDFYCNNNNIFINDEGIYINSENQLRIQPIFRYKAIDHPGERILSSK